MKYQEFIENVKTHIEQQVFSGQKILIQPVLKNNGMVYDGLIILDPILNISPTIYLNPYYHRYLSGISMEDIYEDILTTYRENLPKEDFDVTLFKDFDKAQEHIVMKLIHRDKNRELLEEVPYVPYHDLAIIFVYAICDFMDEYATILIHNQHLQMWNINVEDLYTLAMKNSPMLLPANFESMNKVLEHLHDSSLDLLSDCHIYVLSNKLKIHGATCMIYPGLLKEIADRLNDNLIIIPSSIHEVLILPESAAKGLYELSDYTEMITTVNEEQLQDDEILSDHAYLFLRETEELIYESSENCMS